MDEIRKQIDIHSEIYLKNDLTVGDVESKEEKFIQQKEEMIKEVNLFQGQCLKNLETLQCGPTDLSYLEDSLNKLHLDDARLIWKGEVDLTCALFQRQKLLFMNQGIIFLSKIYSESAFLEGLLEIVEFVEELNELKILFGTLLIVEDEYLSKNEIEILKESR